MDETTTDTPTAGAAPAVIGLRDRISSGRFRAAVREKLEAELTKRARKRGAAFGVSAVPGIVADVTDHDIGAARATAEAGGGVAAAPVGGPILDWFKGHPDLVAKVVAILLKLLGV